MGDPRRPIVPISIGCHSFLEAIYDFSASVNIMPKVIYEKILNDPLLYTIMCLELADQSIFYPEGVLEEVVIRVGQSYVPVDFMVMETEVDEKAPIILGRPFLCTTQAIIYAEYACQDCPIHKGQEREIHIQEPHPERTCSPEAIPSTRRARTATNAKEKEQ